MRDLLTLDDALALAEILEVRAENERRAAAAAERRAKASAQKR